MEANANNNILIIGPPNSGKTTFLAQLYGRMQTKKGVVTMIQTPHNIVAIQGAYERLAEGLETQATPANENLEITIPVQVKGKKIDLTFKDYGGEQVQEITDLLSYDKTWQKRAQENDRWILFIRPGLIYHHYDLTLTGYADISSGNEHEKLHNELSHQYTFIELIQALLHARGSGIKTDLNVPKLVIALTCWDELETQLSPKEILVQKLPFFLHFVSTLWAEDSYTIVGVSSQEFRLDTIDARDKYLDELPESFGYMVSEAGQERDLTRLIEISLEL
jgi:energy-coupling factor transporter ATP-binding protein EcfA2